VAHCGIGEDMTRKGLADYLLYGLDVIGILALVLFIGIKTFPDFENLLQIPLVVLIILFFIILLLMAGLSVNK
jgi:hypothetical protein